MVLANSYETKKERSDSHKGHLQSKSSSQITNVLNSLDGRSLAKALVSTPSSFGDFLATGQLTSVPALSELKFSGLLSLRYYSR